MLRIILWFILGWLTADLVELLFPYPTEPTDLSVPHADTVSEKEPFTTPDVSQNVIDDNVAENTKKNPSSK
jgi:hypothetical protein